MHIFKCAPPLYVKSKRIYYFGKEYEYRILDRPVPIPLTEKELFLTPIPLKGKEFLDLAEYNRIFQLTWFLTEYESNQPKL